MSFQRFQSDFPADANEEDYLEFTTEVVQDEQLGILESDANSIVAEIQGRLKEALNDSKDVIAAGDSQTWAISTSSLLHRPHLCHWHFLPASPPGRFPDSLILHNLMSQSADR